MEWNGLTKWNGWNGWNGMDGTRNARVSTSAPPRQMVDRNVARLTWKWKESARKEWKECLEWKKWNGRNAWGVPAGPAPTSNKRPPCTWPELAPQDWGAGPGIVPPPPPALQCRCTRISRPGMIAPPPQNALTPNVQPPPRSRPGGKERCPGTGSATSARARGLWASPELQPGPCPVPGADARGVNHPADERCRVAKLDQFTEGCPICPRLSLPLWQVAHPAPKPYAATLIGIRAAPPGAVVEHRSAGAGSYPPACGDRLLINPACPLRPRRLPLLLMLLLTCSGSPLVLQPLPRFRPGSVMQRLGQLDAPNEGALPAPAWWSGSVVEWSKEVGPWWGSCIAHLVNAQPPERKPPATCQAPPGPPRAHAA